MMILNQKQCDEFHLKGYINGGRVLTDDQVELLRDELRKVMEGTSEFKPLMERNLDPATNKNNVVVQIVNIWEASPAYLEHAKNPLLTETVARLCNNTDTLRIWHDQIQYKLPKIGGVTKWHQDHPAWPVIQPADLISAWVALDDVDEENGCMWMVPGSHRWGKIPMKTTDDFKLEYDASLLPPGVEVKFEPLRVKKGEVGFHHCMTWHGSNRNLSDRHRRAIAVHYMPGYTRYTPEKPHPVEKHITVKPGEVLQGKHFPVVYERTKRAESVNAPAMAAAY